MAQRNRIRCVLTPWMFRGQGIFVRRQQTRLQKMVLIYRYVQRFKRHITWLYNVFLKLDATPISPQFKPHYKEWLAILIDHTTRVYRWCCVLPNDPSVLSWLPWSYLGRELNGNLMSVTGGTNLMSILTPTTHIKNNFISALQQCDLANKYMGRLKKFHLWGVEERKSYSLPPYIIADIIKILLAMNMSTEIEFDLLTPRLPHIISNPIIVSFLLFDFLSDFRLRDAVPGQTRLQLRSVAQGAEFSITVQDFRFMPDLWERLRSHFYYEALYEIGGTLAPLTWDEGYGQGVILCLPWAQPPHEKQP